MNRSLASGGTHTGTAHWIDHFVCNSVDIPRWAAFNHKILGATDDPEPVPGIFQKLGAIRIGAFVARTPMPPTLGLGKGLPRYGYYIHKADIDTHRRRLEANGVVHDDPVRRSDEGDTGTAIAFQDPEGNQFEFWASDAPPAGALTKPTELGVGRISHGVFESRDLERTADFFKRFCELEPLRSSDIATDTLVLPLASGGRIIFKRVDRLGGRTTGMGMTDVHTALAVHQDSFFPNYRRLWDNLPEWDYDVTSGRPVENREMLPARTVMHPSPEGRPFYALVGHGDDFLDWDTNLFHFIGGTPRNGSLAEYDGYTVGAFTAAWREVHGGMDGFGEMVTGKVREKVLV